MSILGRFSNLIKSNLNAAVDKLSDPAKEVDLLIEEMEEELKKLRLELRDQLARQGSARGLALCRQQVAAEALDRRPPPPVQPGAHEVAPGVGDRRPQLVQHARPHGAGSHQAAASQPSRCALRPPPDLDIDLAAANSCRVIKHSLDRGACTVKVRPPLLARRATLAGLAAAAMLAA